MSIFIPIIFECDRCQVRDATVSTEKFTLINQFGIAIDLLPDDWTRNRHHQHLCPSCSAEFAKEDRG